MALDTDYQCGLFPHSYMRKPNIHRHTLLHSGMEMNHIHPKLLYLSGYGYIDFASAIINPL